MSAQILHGSVHSDPSLHGDATQSVAAAVQRGGPRAPAPAPARRPGACDPGLRLSDLFRAAPVRQVRSKVLGEVVVFAQDGAQLPPDLRGMVVYRQSELHHLIGVAPQQLRAIHAVKQRFDGEVIG